MADEDPAIRYFLEIAYSGTAYHGWQKQPNANTVQQEVENALTLLNSGVPIETIGCGRTDTGVHARRFFLHFEAPLYFGAQHVHKLNRMLPANIAAKDFYLPEQPTAHARFDATGREYRYFIHRNKDPFRQYYSAWMDFNINVSAMNEAAQMLLGEKNFTALSKVSADTLTDRCHVRAAKWEETESGLMFIVTADRFLRGMVRIMVGSMLAVGTGKKSVAHFKQMLDSGDRSMASGAAPAAGLHLWQVQYPAGLLKKIE